MAQDWDDLGAVDPTTLGEARLQAHHAVQWVTRAARANLTPMPDDSQTNLGWDRGNAALVSHDLPVRSDAPLRVGLQIATMTLIILRGGALAEQFALDGRSHAEAGAWLDRLAAAAGLALPGGETLPYAIPAHPVGDGAPYAAAAQRSEFVALAHWFAAADDILGEIHARLPQGEASPLRCWPHHFDIATLWTLGDGDAENAPSIAIGLSPGDSYYPQPYFYVSPWPRPAPEKLPPLAAPGHWHTADFIGAILSGDAVAAMADRRNGTRQFLDAAIAAARGLVAKP
jgi:hypothetical protein